jgi:hypothetical protein
MHVHALGLQRSARIERQQSTSDLGHDTPSRLHLLELEWILDVCYKGFAPFSKLENFHAQAMFLLLQKPTKNPTIGISDQWLEEAIEP